MSLLWPTVKQTFEHVALASDSVGKTANIAFNLACNFPMPIHGGIISIIGRVDVGKTAFATGLLHAICGDHAPNSISRNVGGGNPSYKIWTDTRKLGPMLRLMDMTVISMAGIYINQVGYTGHVPPSLRNQTIDVVEHATPNMQTQSLFVVNMRNDGETDRLIDLYFNPNYIKPHQIKDLRLSTQIRPRP